MIRVQLLSFAAQYIDLSFRHVSIRWGVYSGQLDLHGLIMMVDHVDGGQEKGAAQLH